MGWGVASDRGLHKRKGIIQRTSHLRSHLLADEERPHFGSHNFFYFFYEREKTNNHYDMMIKIIKNILRSSQSDVI